MGKFIFLLILSFLFIISITTLSAMCNEGQIDINTASAEKLKEIIWIGDATAPKVISARPFSSVNDLTKVSGIKEAKLADIKFQGLACVGAEEDNGNEEETRENNNVSKEDVVEKANNTNLISSALSNSLPSSKMELETINLNPKDIKTEENSEKTGENYAVYWLIAFSILLGVLFALRKNKYKNEFK